MPPRTFVTLASYKAEDPSNEFSFQTGERFVEAGNPEASPDDAWILVHRPDAPDQSKYVPVDRLIEEKCGGSKYRLPRNASSTMSNDNEVRVQMGNEELVSAISGTSFGRDGSISSGASPLSKPEAPTVLSPSISSSAKKGQSEAAASGAAFGGSLSAVFKAILEKHEAYFAAVAKKREESFSKISASIGEVNVELAKCRERNSAIRSQIAELDTMIAAERARWQHLAGKQESA